MLTNTIYDEAKSKIEEIENMGGSLTAIENGFQQREIHEAAWAHLNQVESGERKIVGVNHGVLEEEEMPDLLTPDPDLWKKQTKKLENLREKRDNHKAKHSLEMIEKIAQSGENLFPYVIDALRNDCTLGEIINAMKKVFGTYMAPSGF